MANRRTLVRITVAVAAALALAACQPPPPDTPGKVTDHGRIGHKKFSVCVTPKGGKETCGTVSKRTYVRCPVGSTWPVCKTTPKPKGRA